MGRQDGERASHGFEEEHQDRRPGRIVVGRRTRHPLVPIPQRRLIAMVAVGDQDGPRGSDADQLRGDGARPLDVGLTGGYDPQPVPRAVIVVNVHGRIGVD